MKGLGKPACRVGLVSLLFLVLLPPGVLRAAEEAAAHAEPGIVNLNITTLIQVVNFLILIALLSRFLFKPLQNFLAQRAEGIEKSLAEARLARESAAKAQEDYRAQLLAAHREAAGLREQAQREVEVERQRLLKASREEAQRVLEDAKASIEVETRRAQAALRQEVVTLSLMAAERLLGRALTTEDQKRLAEQFVRDVGSQN